MEQASLVNRTKAARRVGVEIGLGGLDETAIAGTIMYLFGGHLQPDGAMRVRVCGTQLGDMVVELDTAYAETLDQGPRKVVLLARHIVPSEIVTDPIAERDLPKLDTLVKELRAAGATGNNASPLHGFGVHFNPEVQSDAPADILRIMQAYALLEPWLRTKEPMGFTRRSLPFTDPWPIDLRDALAEIDPDSLTVDALIDLYLYYAPSRNYGLDMLPLFGHLDEDRVARKMGDNMPSTRPTYHFRLPTSRVDEPGWKITSEWAKWRLVERLSAKQHDLSKLCRAWRETAQAWLGREDAWARRLPELIPNLIS